MNKIDGYRLTVNTINIITKKETLSWQEKVFTLS